MGDSTRELQETKPMNLNHGSLPEGKKMHEEKGLWLQMINAMGAYFQ